MGVDAEVARSRGDVMFRLRQLEKAVERMRSDRRLEAAAIGAGGLRVKGGVFRAQDSTGSDMFRVGGDPGELFLRPDLLSPLAVEVLADRLHTTPESATLVESAPGTGAYTGAHFSGSPLPGADLGLTGVEVVTGAALVTVSAQVRLGLAAGEVQAAHLSFEVGGATNQPATDARGAKLQWGFNTHDHSVALTATESKSTFITGLEPGAHSFTLRYRVEQPSQPVAQYAFRNLTVLAL